jgi:hypothetical protein
VLTWKSEPDSLFRVDPGGPATPRPPRRGRYLTGFIEVLWQQPIQQPGDGVGSAWDSSRAEITRQSGNFVQAATAKMFYLTP